MEFKEFKPQKEERVVLDSDAKVNTLTCIALLTVMGIFLAGMKLAAYLDFCNAAGV